MLIAITKIGTKEMVGRYALALALTAPVVLFSNLQLRLLQATDATQEFRFGQYLALRLVATALALMTIVGLALLQSHQTQTAWTIVAVGIAKAIESISDIVFGLLQRRERMDRIAMSMIIKGPVSLAAFGAALASTNNVAWAAATMAASWAAILLFYDVPNARRVEARGDAANSNGHSSGLAPIWDLSSLRRLAWIALPMGVVTMLMSLNTNVPRYFVEHYCGQGELGIFAAVAYLVIVGTQVVSALGQSAMPRLGRCFADRDCLGFKRLLLSLVLAGAAIGTVGVASAVLMGREILRMLYRGEYAQRVDVLVVLAIMAAVAYVANLLGYAMTAARYLRVQLALFAAVVAMTAVLARWLVPDYGLRGAALAALGGAVVQLVGALAGSWHALRALRSGVS